MDSMYGPTWGGGRRLSGPPGLVEACAWLADADLAEDPEQAVAALCELYQLLAAQGWVPSEKAAVLLHVHAGAVEAELSKLVGVLGTPGA